MKTHAMDASPKPSPKKYELVHDERMTLPNGTVVYRIRALKDFRNIEAGTLGGWVQSEDNLSQDGTCWLSDSAMAIENARVSEDAFVRSSLIFGDAKVSGTCAVMGDAQVGGSSVVGGKLGIVDGKVFAGEGVTIDQTAGQTAGKRL